MSDSIERQLIVRKASNWQSQTKQKAHFELFTLTGSGITILQNIYKCTKVLYTFVIGPILIRKRLSINTAAGDARESKLVDGSNSDGL